MSSNHLSHVLDGFGLSRSFTEYRRRAFNYVNIGFISATDHSLICVGSKRDALCSSNDTESDIDIIAILPALVFDEKDQDKAEYFLSNKIPVNYPVLILESGPNRGYKHLKYLSNRNKTFPYTYTHYRGKQYLLNTNKVDLTSSDDPDFPFEVHGPALSSSVLDDDGLHLDFDAVIAFHCPSLPADFDEWCLRKRFHGWPSSRIIESTKEFGCLVVAVGHQGSDTQAIEWRLSLSKTEHLLTKSFNHVQMKCYVLMKLLLKWIIQPQVKDALSSYHIKTVMFWMSEEHERSFWMSENLNECLMVSFRKLRSYVENKCCPNYFIPGVNLLERKLNGDIHHIVLNALDDIITKGPSIVYQCLPLNIETKKLEVACQHQHNESCECLYQHLLQTRVGEMFNIDCSIKENISILLIKEDLYRRCYFGLTDWHVLNEIHNHSELASDLFSSIAICEEMGLPNKYLYCLHKFYVPKLRENGYVARIKLATLFYYRRRLGYCKPLLSLAIRSMESSQEFEVCKEEGASAEYIETIEGVECIYLTQNNKGFRVSEIVFSPCDKCLIPPDLQDEMGRPKTVNGTHYEGWVFVDSVVYAYYLLIVTLHDMRTYRGIETLFRRFHKVCTQQPGSIRIFRKDAANRLYNHAFMLVWTGTKGNISILPLQYES